MAEIEESKTSESCDISKDTNVINDGGSNAKKSKVDNHTATSLVEKPLETYGVVKKETINSCKNPSKVNTNLSEPTKNSMLAEIPSSKTVEKQKTETTHAGNSNVIEMAPSLDTFQLEVTASNEKSDQVNNGHDQANENVATKNHKSSSNKPAQNISLIN